MLSITFWWKWQIDV